MTPAEAALMAAKLAAEEQPDAQQQITTQLAHAGVSYPSFTNCPLSPPLHFATTYTRPVEGPYLPTDAIYARLDNPTRLALETEVFQLETAGMTFASSAEDPPLRSLAFASGMMAISSIILAHRSPLVVMVPQDTYHGVPTVLMDVFSRFQVERRKVDMNDISAFKKALRAVDSSHVHLIVWMETPSNPQCHVLDIAKLSQLAHQYHNTNVTCVVDSTLHPLQQPLQYRDVDICVQAATKYMAGHSDALLGVVTTLRPDFFQKLHQVQDSVGGVAAPMDCWLTLRGLRTLVLRFQQQSDSALQLAQFFQNQIIQKSCASLQKVYYPGLPSHPQHALAVTQMKTRGGYGGVLSVEFNSEAFAMAWIAALQVAYPATSLGGTETLVEHRASIEPPCRVVSPIGLVRISVGLENVQDLLKDFAKALRIATQVLSA
ncbi:cystathionine gamma-lyase [Fistulifera solaris]|uniref:cystathionine gamma-lyase n=1 Tax=Fistulifera solaris TaxID=1519565 RepID=A0A1Z5KSN8_FISSO|nr:cystathionine gamma-lyase [Fistulifera solaris]|eukprot:GAX29309.1 cystathionine gamma-lyase [Fistulifera solaris]